MSEHIVSRSVYFVIFGALIVLTVVTYLASRVDFGSESINTIIALAIAVTKAVLVILYFMHVRYSPRLTWVVVVSGFFWLAIMITLTLSDYLTRPYGLPGPR
ncbi:MAG TPA: cytochrome C oxidase subunit IV family protein [Pyrinomonadaceae bacterium]|jgi:cytochrome c oxidase subunit 4